MNKFRVLIYIFLILFIFSSCKIDLKNNKDSSVLNTDETINRNNQTDRENVKEKIDNIEKDDSNKTSNKENLVRKVSLFNTSVIEIDNANLSNKSFEKYYFELPKNEKALENVIMFFPSYFIGAKHVFYTVAYQTPDAAGVPRKIELYMQNMKNGEIEMIYEVERKYIYDMCSALNYVYFLEDADNKCRLLKIDLENKEIIEIKTWDECYVELSISDEYLIWYEDGKGMFYNHKTEELLEIPLEDMILEPTNDIMLYGNFDINNSFLTFMTKNEKDWLFIHRYNLQSKEKTSVLILGNAEPTFRYMSNENWIYWFEQAGSQRIFLYNIENGSLHVVNKDEKFRIYSTIVKDNTLYINAKYKTNDENEESKCIIYKVDLCNTADVVGYTSIDKGLNVYSSYFTLKPDGHVYVYSDDIEGGGTNIYILE